MHLPMGYMVPRLDHLTHLIVLATILLILYAPRGHTGHCLETEKDANDGEIGVMTTNVGVVETEVARKVETSLVTGRTEIEIGVGTGMEILATELTDAKSQIVTTVTANETTGTDAGREMRWTTF